MKRNLRVLGLLILAAILLTTASFAADEPDGWAAEAVQFSVEQGLFMADNARPHADATRAELAQMLTKLFRIEQGSDLSGITDVAPDSWYYNAMAKAVSMGIYQGNAGKLEPEAALSREQAMTVLARAFGISSGDRAVLAAYTDAPQLSVWAAGSVAGLVQAEIVTGSNAKLNPKGRITRQELAVLLQKLTGTVATEAAVPETGSVLWAAAEPPQNLTVHGNLYLAGGNAQEMILRNVTVEGKLVVHAGSVTLQGSTKAEEVVVCGENLTLQTNANSPVRVSGGSASLSGGGSSVIATAPSTLTGGSWQKAEIAGTTLTVSRGATVSTAALTQKNSTVTGEGTVRSAVIYQKNCKVDTLDTKLEEKIDAGVEQVKVTAALKANEAKPSAPTIYTTVQFNNVDVTNCLGAEQNVRLCTLNWYVDGVLVQKVPNFALSEGVTAKFTTTAQYTGKLLPNTTIRAELCYADETVRFEQTVSKHTELLASLIHTLNVEATTRRATSLYANMNLTGWICNLPAGTTGVYYNYSGTFSGAIRLSDGRTGWVRWSDLSISNKDYVEATDYTKEQKENYVNVKGYESDTGYLVWVSLLKQKVNVFQGEKGNWTLVRTCCCASGKNRTPTVAGVFKYQYRNNVWDFDSYYVKQAMVFNGGHAFHTRTYVKSTGGLLDPTMGKTVSNGCIRMYDEDVYWLVDNMPFQTTVVVY